MRTQIRLSISAYLVLLNLVFAILFVTYGTAPKMPVLGATSSARANGSLPLNSVWTSRAMAMMALTLKIYNGSQKQDGEVYIIDTYDKYSRADRQTAKLIFLCNDTWYAIKKCEVRHGKLIRPQRIDENENENEWFFRYDTFEEAEAFARLMRRQ